MVLNRSKNNKCRIFKKMIQLQTTVNEKKTQMDEDRLQVWSSGDEKWYNLGECTIYMYPLPHFNNLLSSGHIYRVNFLGFITDLGRMNIGYKIKKFKIKFSRKIIKKNLGFYPYLVLDSFFVQSSSSLLEQYIGLCPNTIIQGRLLLASGVLASNKGFIIIIIIKWQPVVQWSWGRHSRPPNLSMGNAQHCPGRRLIVGRSAWNRTISGSLHLVVDLYRIRYNNNNNNE